MGKSKGSDLGEREQQDHAVEAQKHLDTTKFKDSHYVAVCPDNQLFIDIDCNYYNWRASEEFFRLLDLIKQTYNMETRPTYTAEMSKGGNTHVIVDLPFHINVYSRVAWQAILGGDPVREACHLLSLSRGDDNIIILFRIKPAPRLLTDGR